MGIDVQRSKWQCGPAALKHALLTLGIYAEERDLARIAHTSWIGGSDELQLGRAARAYDCDLTMIRRLDPGRARRTLVQFLRRGIPVLLAVDEWSHWITAVKEEQGKFIVMDSEDEAVLTILTWSQLQRRWVYHEWDEVDDEAIHTFYDLHAVLPRFRVQTRTKFSVARARYLRRPENRTLSQVWDEYAEDLGDLCKIRTPLSEHVFSMGEFLRRHEALIVDQVTYWHGEVEPRAVEKILGNMHFVADTLGMVIHKEDEKRVISGISILLALWAARDLGVGPVYEPEPRKRRRRKRR